MSSKRGSTVHVMSHYFCHRVIAHASGVILTQSELTSRTHAEGSQSEQISRTTGRLVRRGLSISVSRNRHANIDEQIDRIDANSYM